MMNKHCLPRPFPNPLRFCSQCPPSTYHAHTLVYRVHHQHKHTCTQTHARTSITVHTSFVHDSFAHRVHIYSSAFASHPQHLLTLARSLTLAAHNAHLFLISVYTHTHTHTHARTHARTQAHTHARTHIHTQTNAQTHASTETDARTHTQTHTHIHTHTHTHSPSLDEPLDHIQIAHTSGDHERRP